MTDTHIKIKPVTPKVQYTANGSTTVFPYEFAIFADSDMVVYVDDEIIESGYTVSGAGQTDGGNVTFSAAPASGKKITLLRNVPIERITDFQEGGTFRPKNINDELDRQTAFVQQVQEKIDRAVIFGPTSTTDPEEVLIEVERIYNSIDNVEAVADDISNVNTVATNISDIGTCATNIAAIIAAPTEAGNAANSATAAANSASAAALSAASCMPILFDHKWTDYEVDNMAWLRADTYSWQDGTVYSNAYQHLVDDIDGKTATTETVAGTTVTYYLADDGHKIVKVDDVSAIETVYSATGVAWYYVLDTSNQRFKLPRTKYGFIGLRDTVGKYVPETLPNIKGGDIAINKTVVSRSDGALYIKSEEFSTTTGISAGSGLVGSLSYDGSRSSSTYQDDAPVQQRSTQMYLYFYVGEFTETATEQTAGLNASLFNGKVDLDFDNMNPSATAKQTINGWGIPDYSAGVSISSGYVATSNGYVTVVRSNGSSMVYLYIDNVQVNSNESNTSSEGGTISAFVAKGSTVTWTTGNISSSTFFPLIGG